MPFKQSYSAPDPLKSLLPCGVGLHDSYQKLFFICSLMNLERGESDSEKLLVSYVSTNWPKILGDLKAADQSNASSGSACSCCKGGSGGKHCFPCKAHCWTRCKGIDKMICDFSTSDRDSISPIGGGLYSEMLQLMKTSKKVAGIIKEKRFELGKLNASAMQKNFKSLNIPKDQGLPLIEATIFSFAQSAIEHQESDGWDVMTFTPDNFFASFAENSKIFNEIMSVEMCTAAPWFAGYCEVIAKVKVEYNFNNKPGEPFSVRLQQM